MSLIFPCFHRSFFSIFNKNRFRSIYFPVGKISQRVPSVLIYRFSPKRGLYLISTNLIELLYPQTEFPSSNATHGNDCTTGKSVYKAKYANHYFCSSNRRFKKTKCILWVTAVWCNVSLLSSRQAQRVKSSCGFRNFCSFFILVRNIKIPALFVFVSA